MKNLFIYLFIYFLLNSCNNKLHKIRENIKGHIYNELTRTPLDSVKIGFLINPSNQNNQKLEEAYFSNIRGYFKIPLFEIETDHQQSKSIKSHSSKYLKIGKKGFVTDIIYIKDSVYRRNEKFFTIYIDTIFLKPI
ncbi:MAG: hypothetical protein L3J23_09440 [Flavobacteriaceae bacterium]|nr:hypothetical protein [Flavobacteriaceae bacterium]